MHASSSRTGGVYPSAPVLGLAEDEGGEGVQHREVLVVQQRQVPPLSPA
jgi:hypothetical protein